MRCLWHPREIDEELPKRLTSILETEACAKYFGDGEGRSVVHKAVVGDRAYAMRRIRAVTMGDSFREFVRLSPSWREWRTAVCLAHTDVPHVAPLVFLPGLYDQPLIYPFHEGTDLAALMRTGRINRQTVDRVGQSVGVMVAAGWVHRKMEPRKVLIDPACKTHALFVGLRHLEPRPNGYAPIRMMLRLWRAWCYAGTANPTLMRRMIESAEAVAASLAEPDLARDTLFAEIEFAQHRQHSRQVAEKRDRHLLPALGIPEESRKSAELVASITGRGGGEDSGVATQSPNEPAEFLVPVTSTEQIGAALSQRKLVLRRPDPEHRGTGKMPTSATA